MSSTLVRLPVAADVRAVASWAPQAPEKEFVQPSNHKFGLVEDWNLGVRLL